MQLRNFSIFFSLVMVSERKGKSELSYQNFQSFNYFQTLLNKITIETEKVLRHAEDTDLSPEKKEILGEMQMIIQELNRGTLSSSNPFLYMSGQSGSSE